MIGKYQLQLGSEQIVSGMASSDFATDGALGTSSVGLNPFLKPGVIRPIAAPTLTTTPIAGSIIASSEDSPTLGNLSSTDRTLVDDAANYYFVTAGVTTLKQTGVATTKYVAGKVDMLAFKGNTYTSIQDDISIWTTASNSFTESWWVTTKSQTALVSNVPHPLLSYQGNMYIGNGSNIHSYDGTTITTNVLSLNEVIYALGIDPVTGMMLISVQSLVNYSDTLPAKNFVYLWDGISIKPLRKIPIEDAIYSFHNVGGTVFVGFGTNLGQWNGNGVSFLRKLQNGTFNGANLPTKHHLSSTRNILHVIDGPNILSYGEAIAGKKAFFYTAYNTQNSNNLTCVAHLGSYKLAVFHSTDTMEVFDFTSASPGSANLYFNNIYFPRPIFIRRVRAITTGNTGNTSTGYVSIIDDKGIETIQQTFVSGVTTTFVFDFDISVKTMALQLRNQYLNDYVLENVRFYIYYDIAE